MNRTATTVTWLSIAETVSFVALLAMMAAGSDAGVSVVGLVHGLLFAAYAIVVWMWREVLGWTTRFAALAILTGPLGALITLERLRRDRTASQAQP
ncbi:MAG: DUF3817 domain-containing protein [Nitriliruptorales bacterium]